MSGRQGRLCITILLITLLFLPAGQEPYPGQSYYLIGQVLQRDILAASGVGFFTVLPIFHIFAIPFLILFNLCLLLYPVGGIRIPYRILLLLFLGGGWFWTILLAPFERQVRYAYWAIPLTATLAVLFEAALIVEKRGSRNA